MIDLYNLEAGFNDLRRGIDFTYGINEQEKDVYKRLVDELEQDIKRRIKNYEHRAV